MVRHFEGIYPAVTTQMREDLSIDFEATGRNIERLIQAGCHGMIMLGTVGENCSLEWDEKLEVVKTAVAASRGRVKILSGVAEYTSAGAARYAKAMQGVGADGLMVLPAMVYKADDRETINHFRTVAGASDLPIMIYNNPIVYGVDTTPGMFAELADVETIVAIKESSDDVRRLTDLINAVGDRYELLSGVDDLVVESVMLGATGWVSGLINAFPEESVEMYNLAVAGRYAEAVEIYRWFMPVLHLDCFSKLVQYIKFAQMKTGLGSEITRPPRMALVGEERARIGAIIDAAISARPRLAAE
ncbi:MAG: dihydrodipicolinate synthase family protein [Proteobacteria bacterium]|nr:dihydrodipicolinate synthase family protein [Pseudomonadota bacterium]MDA1311530.1 dihydrodipicolinate synthase family protein [Pseudomonadota bacterium]